MTGYRTYTNQYLSSILTFGATILLGLLSFSGMWFIWPIFSIATASFFLSMIYEGEIYQQNITAALDKIQNTAFIEQSLAQEFLELSSELNTRIFFSDYIQAKNASLASNNLKFKKRLQQMEIYLGRQIMLYKTDAAPKTHLDKKIHQWLSCHHADIIALQNKYQSNKTLNQNIKIFSSITALLMSIGTIYLIIDTFEILNLISMSSGLLPYIVIPMAIISGISYGFLTYNSLTDFLLKDSLGEWWRIIQNSYQEGLQEKDAQKITYVIMSACILALNLILTICTAGTWWTIVNQSHKIWPWMQHIGIRVLNVLIAPFIALSSLAFNLENTIETINEISAEETQPMHQHSKNTETFWQKWNPFRLALSLTYVPLRILLFLGHLLSISITADKMPGIPAIVSAIFGFLSEGLEDAHYFLDLKNLFSVVQTEDDCNQHVHKHSDLPNQFLQTVFYGLFYLAAWWHHEFQNIDSNKSFDDCLNLFLGRPQKKTAEETALINLSTDWLQTEIEMECNEHIDHLNSNAYIHKALIEEKITAIETLKSLKSSFNYQDFLQQHPAIQQHRFFNLFANPCDTEQLVQSVHQKLFSSDIHQSLRKKGTHADNIALLLQKAHSTPAKLEQLKQEIDDYEEDYKVYCLPCSKDYKQTYLKYNYFQHKFYNYLMNTLDVKTHLNTN